MCFSLTNLLRAYDKIHVLRQLPSQDGRLRHPHRARVGMVQGKPPDSERSIGKSSFRVAAFQTRGQPEEIQKATLIAPEGYI